MGIRILCHSRGSSIHLDSGLSCTCSHCLGCSRNPHHGGSCGLRMHLVGVVDGDVIDETASSYKEHYEYDQQDNEACRRATRCLLSLWSLRSSRRKGRV